MKERLLLPLIFFLSGLQIFGQSERINSSEFIPIGGIDQWVTLSGEDVSDPVVLFLHGGPGSPLTPYASTIFKDWDKELVLVQWDQRGAGRTFGTYAPEELDPEFLKSHPLSLDLMVKDGIELAEYLTKRLGKQKIILFGTSWGSALGARMAFERPDLFHAYIGHSQLVNPSEDNELTYHKLLRLVQENQDVTSLQVLDSIGPPPYDRARNMGRFIRVVKKYEQKNSAGFPEEWIDIPPEYRDQKDAQDRAEGDDYSFLNYAGDSLFKVKPMSSSINLMENAYQFGIPVYLIQGEEDILTPKEVTKAYYTKIEAPQKELILVPGAAHGFDPAVVAEIFKVLKEKVIPGIRE